MPGHPKLTSCPSAFGTEGVGAVGRAFSPRTGAQWGEQAGLVSLAGPSTRLQAPGVGAGWGALKLREQEPTEENTRYKCLSVGHVPASRQSHRCLATRAGGNRLGGVVPGEGVYPCQLNGAMDVLWLMERGRATWGESSSCFKPRGLPLPAPRLHEALPFEFTFSSEAVYTLVQEGAKSSCCPTASGSLLQCLQGAGLHVAPKQSLAPSLFAWFSAG